MKVLRAALAVAYPFVVFAGLHWLNPRGLALSIGTVLALRAVLRWHRPSPAELRRLLAPALLVAGVLAVTWLWNDPTVLLFVPTLMSAALLVAFGRTLVGDGPTLVETFARLQDPDLSPAQIRHCRAFTIAWCGFFLGNGAVALWLTVRGDLLAWTLYNGVLAYLLMGLLFSAEFVLRAWRFGRYEGGLVEPLMKRLFPHDPAP